MYNGRTAITRRGGTKCKMDEGNRDDHNDGHDKGGPLREATPPRFTRGYGSYRMRPYIREPLQCFNGQKFGHEDCTCRSNV